MSSPHRRRPPKSGPDHDRACTGRLYRARSTCGYVGYFAVCHSNQFDENLYPALDLTTLFGQGLRRRDLYLEPSLALLESAVERPHLAAHHRRRRHRRGPGRHGAGPLRLRRLQHRRPRSAQRPPGARFPPRRIPPLPDLPHFSVPFPAAHAVAWLMEQLDPIVPWDPLITRSVVHLLEAVNADNTRAEKRSTFRRHAGRGTLVCRCHVRPVALAGGRPAASSFSCSAKKRNQKKAAPLPSKPRGCRS
jgi:hypothetical protein